MDNPLKYKELGNECLKNKDFQGAVDNYSKAIELDPSNHLFFSNRSAAFASLGKYYESLVDAKKIVELNPTWPKGFSRLGAAYEFLGQYEEAQDAYQQCLTLDPNNEQVKKSIQSLSAKSANQGPDSSMLNSLMNDPATASMLNDPTFLQSMMQALSDPSGVTDPRVTEFMNKMKQSNGINEPSLNDFQTPHSSATHTSPFTATHPPSYSAATSAKPEAAKKEPQKSPSLVEKEIANNFYKQKKFDQALEHYNKALEHDPKDVTIMNNIAAVHFEMKDYKTAIKECKKAIEVGREVHTDYKNLARALARIGNSKMKLNKVDKALVYYNKSLAEFRDPLIIKKVNQIKKEELEKERLAYINPEIAEEERNKGNECFAAGRYPDAISHYSEAIKRNPEDARIYSNRAACFTKLMEFQLCIKDCVDCLKLNPNFIKAHLRKGNAFLAMRQPFNAINAFEDALKLDPNNAEAKDGIMNARKVKSTLSPEELKKQAMDDPAVQEILKDPAMHIILEQMQSDPKAVMTHLQNPEIYTKITKLMDAGIIQMKQ